MNDSFDQPSFSPNEAAISYESSSTLISLPSSPSREELAFDWTLSPSDIALTLEHRGTENICRFAIQICVLRKYKRFLNSFHHVSPDILTYLCQQLDIPTITSLPRFDRRNTAANYQQQIANYLGWHFFDQETFLLLKQWIFDQVADRLYIDLLIDEAVEFLKSHKTILPGPVYLERIVNSIYREAEQTVFQTIAKQIPPVLCQEIDRLLEEEETVRTSSFFQFAEYPPAAKTKHINRFLDRYESLKKLPLEELRFKGVGITLLKRLAQSTKQYSAWQLKRFHPDKRYTLAACFLFDARQRILDYLIDMHEQFMIEMLRRARHSYEDKQRNFRKKAVQGASTLRKLGTTLLRFKDQTSEKEGKSSLNDLWKVIQITEIEKAIEACQQFEYLEQYGLIEALQNRYSNFRRYFNRLLNLPFQAQTGSESLVKAVEILRDLDQKKLKEFPKEPDTSFVPDKWLQKYQGTQIDRKTWEISLAIALKDALKRGDIYVTGSRNHASFWELCFDEASWEAQKETAYQSLGLSQETAVVKENLIKSFEQVASQTAEGLAENSFARIKEGKLKVSKEEKLPVSTEVKELRQLVKRALPKIRIEKLLQEVDSQAGFSNTIVTKARQRKSSDQISLRQALMAGLVAHGTNLGISTMADSTESITIDQLQQISQTYLSEPALYAANATLVNFHHKSDIAHYWGTGIRSSSDGQRFGVQKSSLIATTYPRYFGYYKRAISIYTHTSDQQSVFSTQVISCTEREAPYVLNGLLHNNTELSPKQHYTDTHGYTEQIFGLCHLLGFSFMPRIRNFKKQQLYYPKDAKVPPELESLFSGSIDIDLIIEQWDNLVRVAASLKYKLVSAHIIAKRLINAESSRLAKALTHLGRLIKTTYLLQYINDTELRQAIRTQLNRGEYRHALAKHVFFANQSEFTTGDYFKMINRASCLSLLSNAILVYNTIHIQKLLQELEKQGKTFSPETIARVSPLYFQHIIVNGTYDFSTIAA